MEQKDLDILKFIYQSEEKLKGIEKRMSLLESSTDSKITQVVGKQEWMCKNCDETRKGYDKKNLLMVLYMFLLTLAVVGKGVIWGINFFKILHP